MELSTVTANNIILAVSAPTEDSVREAAQRLKEFMNDRSATQMANAAYTLQSGRKAFAYRQAYVLDKNNHFEFVPI